LIPSEVTVNTQGEKGEDLKEKSRPFQGTVTAKVAPKPIGYALLAFGFITTAIGMGCIYLAPLRAENGRIFCG
jgi:hypothetical protein